MIRRPPRSTHCISSAASDVYKRQVDSADRVKGYEVARNDYVLIEPEELKDVQLESTHTIEIEHFVPRSEIDPVYHDSSYYIVPDDEVGAEAFAVIR